MERMCPSDRSLNSLSVRVPIDLCRAAIPRVMLCFERVNRTRRARGSKRARMGGWLYAPEIALICNRALTLTPPGATCPLPIRLLTQRTVPNALTTPFLCTSAHVDLRASSASMSFQLSACLSVSVAPDHI